MTGGLFRNTSPPSARPHTRKSNPKPPFFLLSGLFKKLLLVGLLGLLTWAYQATCPPPPVIYGTPGGPPITAPRVKLSDGRHLAYKEHGVPKDKAKYKFIFIHGFGSSRNAEAVTGLLTSNKIKSLGIYIVSFDRPGYGESDPNPRRTVKTMAFDIEELADQLGLGQKFYLIGFSMGGQLLWGCLKYIPHRLAGATLLAPVINYWWSGLPDNLATEAFNKQPPGDMWSLRVAHYAPWLTYWWNTQKLFPSSSVIAYVRGVWSRQDNGVPAEFGQRRDRILRRQQGEYESLHRDMMVGFGKWEFDPTQLKNPFPNNEGSVHLWQGDVDHLVPLKLQHYIVQKLPWLHYHQVPGAGHGLPYAYGLSDAIFKEQLEK